MSTDSLADNADEAGVRLEERLTFDPLDLAPLLATFGELDRPEEFA